MNNITYIYALIDPTVNNEIFYVGRTSMKLNYRLYSHVRDGRKRRTAKGRRIAKILDSGFKPKISALATLVDLSIEDIQNTEQSWIDFLGITCRLTNTASGKCGGTGNNKKIDWTDEMINRLGKEPDCDLAIEFGCDRKTVEYHRMKSSISRCPQQNFVIPSMAGWNRKQFPSSVIDALGRMPDHKLAKIAGVQRTTISRLRKRMGIASYAESTGSTGRFTSGMPHPRWNRDVNAGSTGQDRQSDR